jgi:Icc-related predicted phosphoesterase
MIKKVLPIVLFFVFAVMGYLIFSVSPVNYKNPANILTYEGMPCAFPLTIVGDLQRTSLWEILIGRETNYFETNEIIKNISDENPGSVILLGDLVFEGDNLNHWKYFDSIIVPLKNKPIPMFPVIGNHEYLGINTTAFNYLTARFPILKNQHWYSEVCESIALIFLDSNNSEYSEEEWNNQINWFKDKLSKFDNDPAVKGILVFAHHPPYSNSVLTGDDMCIQKGFIPAFDDSKKSLAFISGHAHTYERFVEKRKTFIVSGGGGGPRVLLKTGFGSHHDYYKGSSPRPFNYLLLSKESDGIEVTVKGVDKGKTNFYTLEQFELFFNNPN